MELESHREALAQRGYGIAAISYDTVGTLKHFAGRRGIQFPLLSDADSKVIRAFGIFNDKIPQGNLAYGVPHPGIYVIDGAGVVTARYFEDDFRERFTIGGILTSHFREEPAAAGTAVETGHLRITPRISTTAAAIGHRISVALEIEMKPNLHVYAPGAPEDYIAIRWDLAESAGYKPHPPEFPASERMTLAGDTVPVFQGRFTIRRDLTVSGDSRALTPLLEAGVLTVKGTVRYQACDERQCFPPETVAVEWKVRVEALDRDRAPAELRRPANQ